MTDVNITKLSKVEVTNQQGKVINTFYYDPNVIQTAYTPEGTEGLARGVLAKLPHGLDIRDALAILSQAHATLYNTHSSMLMEHMEQDAQRESTKLDDLFNEIFGTEPAEAVNEEAAQTNGEEVPEELKAIFEAMGISPQKVRVFRV